MGTTNTQNILEITNNLKPEKNNVIASFEALGVRCDSAMESQGLLQLKKKYCDQGKCLSCAIGINLIKN
jgi:hypothetical protein